MSKRSHQLIQAAALAVVLSPLSTTFAVVDGTVTGGEYGLTLATQTNATGFGNNQSELNQALATLTPDGQLQLMLTGNLEANGNGLVIFIDSRAGGAVASTTGGGYGVFGSVGGAKTDDWGNDTDGGEPVSPPPGGPSIVSPGFNPDMSFEINAGGGGPNYYINIIDLHVPNAPDPNRDVFLPDPLDNTRSGTFGNAAVTSTYFRDSGTTDAGTLTFAFDNSNVLGVNGTGDAELGDPTTATAGFEALFSTLFLNADPGEQIKLLPFITNGGGDYLANQFLPGLPALTENLGGPGGPFGGTPLFDAEAGFASPLPNFYIAVPFPEWGNVGAGSWSVDSNWLVTRPDGVNTTAKFGGVITGNTLVTVDGGHTVGAIIFDNSTFSYTLGGAGSITLDALAGKTTRLIVTGSHAINVPVDVQKNLRVSVAPSSALTIGAAVTAASGVAITKDGAGALEMLNVRADGLSVQGGSLKITAGGSANSAGGTSQVKSLAIATGATLDLTNNSMIIDYTGPVGTLVDDVRVGLQDGRLKTTAAAPAGTKLGYADNAAFGTPLATFGGLPVDADSVLIKFTYAGDANIDGQVDINDLAALATAWQTSGGWVNGDFDYSGFVDINDLAALATNWQAGVGAPLAMSFDQAMASVGLGGVSVPEPVSATLLAAGGIGLMARRSRRRA